MLGEINMPIGAELPLLNSMPKCADISPRSSGPSACSGASSSSEVAELESLFFGDGLDLIMSRGAVYINYNHDLWLSISSGGGQQLQLETTAVAATQAEEDLMFYPQFFDQIPPIDEILGNGAFLPSPPGARGGGMSMLLPTEQEDTATRRRVGRPRKEIQSKRKAALEEGTAKPKVKKPEAKRGPKPKYIFANADEALDARRERNRKAALESYYRKREKMSQLEGQAQKLKDENAALEDLLQKLTDGKSQLKEVSQLGINAWLKENTTSSFP